MGAVAGTVGLGEGAVLALLAGVDALCLGADLDGEAVADQARDALVAAVRSGRLPVERLAEAATRVRALAGRFPVDPAGVGPAGAGTAGTRTAGTGTAGAGTAGAGTVAAGTAGARTPGTRTPGTRTAGTGTAGAGTVAAGAASGGGLAEVGMAAARRAVRVVGSVRLGTGAPVLVELDPAPTIAVGRTAWGLAGLLPGATELRVGPDDPLPELPADRPLVVVARDAARVGWVGRAVDGLLAARPDAVVVEMGLPGPVPAAAGWIATGGASAASARAAADLLTAGP